MSGNCPVCGVEMAWTGVRWVEHAQEAHDEARRGLLEAVRGLLDREADRRLRGAHRGAQGFDGQLVWGDGNTKIVGE